MAEVNAHYVAYSTDPMIRQAASSGGFCKAFLLFLLESGTCDYVIMTRMKAGATSPESIITNRREDILARSNSIYEYYNQVAILTQLDPASTYAFIGLPCFVRHIRLEQAKGRYGNIVLAMGLFCNQAPSHKFKHKPISDAHLPAAEVNEIDYRWGGQDNRIMLRRRDGTIDTSLGFREVWSLYNSSSFQYALPVCMKCDLFEADMADISIGDPWLTEFASAAQGYTKIICRSTQAALLVRSAVDKGYIVLQREPTNTIAYRTSIAEKHWRRRHHRTAKPILYIKRLLRRITGSN
jgi:coenzyme F420-reducing hydrogenase beta subunit